MTCHVAKCIHADHWSATRACNLHFGVLKSRDIFIRASDAWGLLNGAEESQVVSTDQQLQDQIPDPKKDDEFLARLRVELQFIDPSITSPRQRPRRVCSLNRTNFTFPLLSEVYYRGSAAFNGPSTMEAITNYPKPLYTSSTSRRSLERARVPATGDAVAAPQLPRNIPWTKGVSLQDYDLHRWVAWKGGAGWHTFCVQHGHRTRQGRFLAAHEWQKRRRQFTPSCK